MGSLLYGAGLVLIEVNVLAFVVNIFATVLARDNPHPGPVFRTLLFKNWFWWGLDRIAKGNVVAFVLFVITILRTPGGDTILAILLPERSPRPRPAAS